MWKMIDGYFSPYRIDEEANVERLHADGKWFRLSPYMLRNKGKGYSRLCVRMQKTDGKYLNVKVKRLMVDAFFGGKKPGVVYGHRNGMSGDCSVYNLYPTTKKTIGKKSGGSERRSVEKIDREGNVIALYSSVTEAAQKNYLCRKSVWVRCAGRLKGDPFALDGYNYRYEVVD